MKILAHTCLIGTTGYANHARSFFTTLNKYHQVKVRNLTIGGGWKGYNIHAHDNEPYINDELKDMLYLQTLYNTDDSRTDYPLYNYDGKFKPDVHIVLMETDHHYFYDDYDGYKIAYNVWETTEYPEHFFRRLFYYNEVWVPTQWQADCLHKQGYPKDRIFVVPEGVDIETFKPLQDIPKKDKFRFLLFGRWDYRKATGEILKTFTEVFKGMEDKVEMICSIENPYPNDGLKTTEERLKKFNIDPTLLKILDFPSRDEYVKYLQEGDVFVSCARSEGWNLPLCIPEGKYIYSNETFKPIENVKENDFVFSHKGKEQKVIKTFKREYNGSLSQINLYNDIDALELTPEHPVYTIKRNRFITKKGKFNIIKTLQPEWVKSKEIEKGDIIIRTSLNQIYFENEIIDLTKIDERLKYNDIDVWYNTGYNIKSELKKYKRFVNLHDLAFLFGWYIAEGCNGNNRLIFTLNAKKEIDIAEKIITEIYEIFGINGSYKIKGNTLRVVINSVLLCNFFDYYCGSMSFNKKIPEKILLGPLNVLDTLINNMVLGDGHLSKDKYTSYTTVSMNLSRQLIFANQRLGIKSTIQVNKRSNRTNRKCYVVCWSFDNENYRHSNKSWWHPEGLAILVKNVLTIPYSGFVYNLEVENDNSYLMSNATVHNCEAMSVGTPSIYSNWGGQLEFAKGKGIPVKISGLKSADFERKDFTGDYCEPDFYDLGKQMILAYENYDNAKFVAEYESKYIHENFTWDKVTQIACKRLEQIVKPFVFVTTGNLGYMPIIEKLVKSINEFSKSKVIVYGVDCEVPFDSPNLIKRRINPKPYSQYDKWYWKQHACIESLKEDFTNFVWIDGDVVVNYNIDDINGYFHLLTDYPISDVHRQEEFFGEYVRGKTQLFNQELAQHLNVNKSNPYAHVCMYIYNKRCKWWFKKIIDMYTSLPIEDYLRLYFWNDEGIDNSLRWVNKCKTFLPLSNFDTSSYDGEHGNTNKTLEHFYTFWKEDGPKNFGQIYGYQYIPEDKSQILYFHGNKDCVIADEMIDYIKIQRDRSFYKSMYFYTDEHKVKNLGSIFEYKGSTLEVAGKFGWDYAIFHEIYNLREYYLNRERKIFDGNIVVDLGGNIGIFNRWAYSQGASKVISFEPDKRYFKLLSLNADPRSILFNAAIGDKIGEIELFESEHLGGSSVHEFSDYIQKYKTRTYNLDYLFETGLIDRIDYLKIDIEGAEIDTLKGISDENLSKVKAIAMEYHHAHLGFDDEVRKEFIGRLNRLGFNSHLMFLGNDNHLQLIYFSK